MHDNQPPVEALFDVYARRRGEPRIRLVLAAVPFSALRQTVIDLEADNYCEASILPADPDRKVDPINDHRCPA